MKRTLSLPTLKKPKPISKRHVSFPNFVETNEDDIFDKGIIVIGSNLQEFIPPRPFSRHSTREMKDLALSINIIQLHEDCPDDSRCILVLGVPENGIISFICAHCKKSGDFISQSTFTEKLPPYQCTLCKVYIHNECLISKINSCCIIV